MKTNLEACDLRRLDLFLRGRLPQDYQADVEAHLQVCPACRDRLDELAGGTRWWSAVQEYLGTDGADALAPTTDPAVTPLSSPWEKELGFLKPSPHASSLGRLGSYEVLEVIGQGGMGLVLRAFDPSLHRPVAIKVLAAEFATSGAARQRFEREARAAAAVVHDHVVPVHAVDAEASPPYLVMGLIPGRSLQQRIDAMGPLGVKEILRIAMQTASGLAAAHAQGLVHRDIKPANIMLENGVERVRITDFGLARAVDDASVTQSGALAGTPQYMAPEQARGEAIDQRADLFSLGSTMYAMCTGYPPFRATSSVAVLRLVCDTEPASIRSVNSDIPAWLEGIIRKLHAKDPSARFPSAAVVADLLERCLAHVQQPDRQPLPAEAEALGLALTGVKLPRRIKGWKWGLAAACGILAISAWYCARPTPSGAGKAIMPGEPALTPVLSLEQYQALDGGGNQYQSDSARVRSRLTALEQSLLAPAPPTGTVPLSDLRTRMESLRARMRGNSLPELDPWQAQFFAIRQRMTQLGHELSHLLNDAPPPK